MQGVTVCLWETFRRYGPHARLYPRCAACFISSGAFIYHDVRLLCSYMISTIGSNGPKYSRCEHVLFSMRQISKFGQLSLSTATTFPMSLIRSICLVSGAIKSTAVANSSASIEHLLAGTLGAELLSTLNDSSSPDPPVCMPSACPILCCRTSKYTRRVGFLAPSLQTLSARPRCVCDIS